MNQKVQTEKAINTEIVETPKHLPTVQESSIQLIQTALEKGIDADGLEKLVDLQHKILKIEAESSYNVVMLGEQF